MTKVDSIKIQSDITVFMKYARYLSDKQRRENWKELCFRDRDMLIKKYPDLHLEIVKVFKDYVIPKKVLPSMRSMQFAGKAIEVNPVRIFNCSYLPVDHYKAFSETMFLLLSGTGAGYSVQRNHVDKLPVIRKPLKSRRYLVEDSIAGWADAVKRLMMGYMLGKSLPIFDFGEIREKGAMLITSGGKAPGPEPLKDCLHNIKKILDRKNDGEKLTPLECHDIQCFIADCVLSGGIRRAACISFFDINDNEMLSCKAGSWWELNPQRGRANNSAVLLRHKITKEVFFDMWKKIQASGSGEPGFYLTNDADKMSNPCCFTGDTLIKTSEGFKEIGSLVGKDIELYNKDGELHKGSVWSTGIKETVKIRNSSGDILECTPDHEFMVNTGSTIIAENLKGSRLMPSLSFNTINDFYTKLGFIQGDGGLCRLNSPSHKGLEVCIGKDDGDIGLLFDIERTKGKHSYYVNGYNDKLKELGFISKPLPERGLPTSFDDWEINNQLSFLRGLFSANGCVIKDTRVSFKSTCYDLISSMVDHLRDFNIECYITTNKSKDVKFKNGTYTCKESYDLNIAKYSSLSRFAELIGFVHEYKTIKLKDILINNSPMITSVKKSDTVEVFDFNIEDDTHWGVVGEGFIAHNCEISLSPHGLCNLTEINMSTIESQEDFNNRAKAASFIGTLQAGFTDFYYLRDIWKKTAEKEALIGVSGTGICSGEVLKYDCEEASNVVVEENSRVSNIIGINEAARCTAIKPSGTTSLVLGTSSGIHAWYSPYYIRRIRVGKNESMYGYLSKNHPELVEDEFFKPDTQAVISIPIKAPTGGIFRDESPIEMLERVKKFSTEWIKPGHRSGSNTHNVSATVSVKDNEWKEVGDWMWKNREYYNGLSVLPYDGGSYTQAPFEEITKYKYDKMIGSLSKVNLDKIIELDDNTDLAGEIACGSSGCEVK